MAGTQMARQSKPTPQQMGRNSGSGQHTYNVTYNINSGGSGGGAGFASASPGPIRRGGAWVRNTMGAEPRQVPLPNGVPRLLGNNKIVGYAWLASMILVSVDEWKNNGILPRPVRLWSTSLIYGVLALVSMIDALVPIANAFAIGYFIMLLWQYFNGQGQFSGETTVAGSTGTTQAPGTSNAGGRG